MFIVIEGADGSGKSTLIRKIQDWFIQYGIDFIGTREPGGTAVGEKIREIILNRSMDPLTELFLYEAARAEHVRTVILPALKEKKVVLSDRFTHSTLTYQGIGRKLGLTLTSRLNAIATTPSGAKSKPLSPDIVVWLKLATQAAMQRTEARAVLTQRQTQGSGQDRFEKEKKQFHDAVYKGFLKLSKKYKQQYIVLDASQTPEAIFESLIKHPLWQKKLKGFLKK